MSAQWFVVQTNPNEEMKADINLRRQNYETWVPSFRKTRRHARKTDSVLSPLFPGYLFVKMDVGMQGWRSINGTFGVRALLCSDSKPLAVPPDFIETLQRQVLDDGSFAQPDAMKSGQIVRITGGAFEDCVATIVSLNGSDRALLLLKILGREVETFVPCDKITSEAA